MSKLKRFPNPGSDINMFIEIFKRTYSILSKKKYFSLYDMELAMIQNYLVSSEGFTGMKAFELSLRDDSSRDPIYNQAKMYAELFRMLGWYSSSPDKNLIFTITELGKNIACNDVSNVLSFKECILGMTDENEVIMKKDGLEMRPFKYFLNIANQLDNKICKLELIYGPYRYPDSQFNKAIEDILSVRGNFRKMLAAIDSFSKESKIAKNTMENYTRFPISTLEYLGWITKEKSDKLYPGSKNMVVMNLTKIGINDMNYYNSLVDIRIGYFNSLEEEIKKAIVRVSFYQQLKRMGISNIKVNYDYNQELEKVNSHFKRKDELLFSPYQMLNNDYVDDVLNITKKYELEEAPIEKNDLLSSVESFNKITSSYVNEIKLETLFYTENKDDKDKEIYKEIMSLKDRTENAILSILMNKYKNANKDVYYPLIGDIFNILGFDCKVSRNGTNYERYDAIIVNEKSIPIEIKSPGEEMNISVKAVRQALENKVILLSRKNFKTSWDITSMVVGYLPPNNRAEVLTLVEDIYNTYNIKISIFDLESLLKLLINKVLFNKVIINDEIYELKGMVVIDDK